MPGIYTSGESTGKRQFNIFILTDSDQKILLVINKVKIRTLSEALGIDCGSREKNQRDGVDRWILSRM